MKRTIFLQAPSFHGFDGGAGARYQAKREIKSFWYPTWLAQPAAMVPGSKLIDAPAHDLSWDDIAHEFDTAELVILHTSTPSFMQDVKTAELIKARNPNCMVGFVGAKVMIETEQSLEASTAIDFVAREEYDYTCVELAEGRPLAEIDGISYRGPDGAIINNKNRAIIEDMDALPMVSPMYKRDLKIDNYFIGYLKAPYVSFYTGRGCKSRCTFCLWPQTISGHRYRSRSVAKVIEEIQYIIKEIPETKEIFYDDDTLTDDIDRVEKLAIAMGELGFGKPGFPLTWSCNAKANVPRKTLEIMKANGCRLLLVGYESGNQQILHTSRRACASKWRGNSPRIATSLALPSTAPSSSACPAKRWKRSRKPSVMRRKSTRTRFRCRWPRPIPARSCIIRRWKTAGSRAASR